jgi:hypothetical protein
MRNDLRISDIAHTGPRDVHCNILSCRMRHSISFVIFVFLVQSTLAFPVLSFAHGIWRRQFADLLGDVAGPPDIYSNNSYSQGPRSTPEGSVHSRSRSALAATQDPFKLDPLDSDIIPTLEVIPISTSPPTPSPEPTSTHTSAHGHKDLSTTPPPYRSEGFPVVPTGLVSGAASTTNSSSGDPNTSSRWKMVGISVSVISAIGALIIGIAFFDQWSRFLKDVILGGRCGRAGPGGEENLWPDWERRTWEYKCDEGAGLRFPVSSSMESDRIRLDAGDLVSLQQPRRALTTPNVSSAAAPDATLMKHQAGLGINFPSTYDGHSH